MGDDGEIVYRTYVGESDLPHIMALVQNELSEPYVIYTYRYFLHQWPNLSFLAYPVASDEPIGVIVCKQSMHREASNRGYIAMLSVKKGWRKRGIARALVQQSVDAMKEQGVEEIVLETEYDNAAALSLYESLGFLREKRLFRFYMNGKDAFRLVLAIPLPHGHQDAGDDGDDADTEEPSANPSRRRAAVRRRIVPDWISEFEDDDEVSSR